MITFSILADSGGEPVYGRFNTARKLQWDSEEEEEEKNPYEFSVETVVHNETNIVFQFNFTNPNVISTGNGLDKIKVQFLSFEMFKTQADFKPVKVITGTESESGIVKMEMPV